MTWPWKKGLETEQGPGGGNSPNRPPLHLQGVGGGCESVGGACTRESPLESFFNASQGPRPLP